MDLNKQIKIFLEGKHADIGLGENKVYFARPDGVLLYDSGNSTEAATIGALVSGAWQASRALAGKSKEYFRFSFDTSDSGVYILPVEITSKEFFVACIYENVTNTGQLKMKLRKLKTQIEEQFKNADYNDNSSADFLFRNITDDEIDNLFAIAGNE